MQSELMNKYVQISRVIITLIVFIVLNTWFIFENDSHWMLAIIISMVVFIFNFPSSKVCKFIINKGDKITNKLFKVLYYAFALPIIFFLVLIAVAWLGILGLFLIESSLDLGIAMLIAFTGIGLFTCILVPYFQTLIMLILRHFLNLRDETNGKN